MAGPLPPPVGGMVTVITDLAGSSLPGHVDLELFDTAKRTPEGRSTGEAVVFRLRLWWRWVTALGGHGPLVAHIHTCSGLSFFFDAILLALALLRGVPAILHIHGGAFDKFLEGLSPPMLFLARAVARHAAFIVVLSDVWRSRLAPWLPGARLRVIENAVPLDPQACYEERESAAGIVLFLGNLTAAKGVWELVEAARDLPGDSRVVMLGVEGEPGIRDRLNARIRELGLSERVELPGPAVGVAKRTWLERAQVFVLPSHVEGLPVSMLEAMAVALPVVVTPVGAVTSVVSDGEEGLIVPVGDAGRLREALVRLISDPQLRRRMGEAGRHKIREHYSLGQRVRDYLQMYAEIEASQRGKAASVRKAQY